MEDTQRIGERIRNARKQRDMTVESLGNCIGVDKATITRYERGYVKKISRMNLEGIAKALNVSMSFLLNGEAVDTDSDEVQPPDYFGREEYRIEVSDTQMAPRMKKGDILYCVSDSEPKDNSVAIIRRGAETMIRNVKLAGDMVIMTSDNPSIPVLTAKIEDFENGYYLMIARVVRMEVKF